MENKTNRETKTIKIFSERAYDLNKMTPNLNKRAFASFRRQMKVYTPPNFKLFLKVSFKYKNVLFFTKGHFQRSVQSPDA